MLDRLISGAGALADLGDRVVRVVLSGSALRGLADRHPGSVVLAIGAIVGAAYLVFAGIEATDNPTPVDLTPSSIAEASELGPRTYASVSGRLMFAYVETYTDENENGTQDTGEDGESWHYYLVEEESRSGVTVRSERSPDEMFRFEGRGVLVRDEAFIEPDLELLASQPDSGEVTVDPAVYLDTTMDAPVDAPSLDLAGPFTDDAAVTLAGPIFTYFSFCSGDPDGDGECDQDEVDLHDLVVVDRGSGRAIVVHVAESPEFRPAAFTGMLRRDPKGIQEAKTAEDFDFATLGITVSDEYVLVDGATPTSAPLAFGLAGVLGALGIALLVGIAGRYLVYRPTKGPLLASARRTFDVGDRLPVRVTGMLSTGNGLVHVREAPAELARVALAGTAGGTEPGGFDPEPATWAAEPESRLLVEPRDGPGWAEVGRGELTRLSVGRVFPLRGVRPAIRAATRTGGLLLSFDSDVDRDRAAAELMAESGLALRGDGTAG